MPVGSAAVGIRRSTRTARSALGAFASQGLNALSSLVIQVIGARTLGVEGFGHFILIYSILIALTALYTGWVGDSLVVLDRADPRVRAGIAASICAWTLAAAATGITCGLLIGTTWIITLEIAALLIVWLLEETGRRIYTARRRYWGLTANDLLYNAVALCGIALVEDGGANLTLETLLLCMIAGSTVAGLASALSLPRAETRLPRPSRESFREIAAFGAWRSFNVGIRPLGLFLARSTAIAVYGAASLSSIQAAWLLLAPAMVLVNGAGMFLLPFLKERELSDSGLRLSTLRTPIVLLACAAAAWSIVAIAFSPSLQRVLFSHSESHLHVGRWAVAGWSMYVVALSFAMPLSMALIARRRPRLVARAQLVETAVGLALVGASCAFAPYWTLPFAMAAGVATGACVTYRFASRLLESSAPPFAVRRASPVPEEA